MADARCCKQVAPPETFSKAIQKTKRVRLEIDFAVANYVTALGSINDAQRRCESRLPFRIEGFEITECFD